MSYCNWGNASPVTFAYHDAEWGLPVREDRRQFEYLMMEVMQCGLSWDLMMKKREIFRRCFDRFDFDKIADDGVKDADGWAFTFRSVVVFGHVEFVDDPEAAIRICRDLARKYNPNDAEIEEEIRRSGAAVQIFALVPEHITGKRVHEA